MGSQGAARGPQASESRALAERQPNTVVAPAAVGWVACQSGWGWRKGYQGPHPPCPLPGPGINQGSTQTGG